MKSCGVCSHPKRSDIDAAIVAGTSYRDVSGQFQVSRSALGRHREHIPVALAVAKQAQEAAQATTLLERVEEIIRDCRAIADKAQRAKDWGPAVAALREARACIELLAKIGAHQLDDPDDINVTVFVGDKPAEPLPFGFVDRKPAAALPPYENGNGNGGNGSGGAH